MKQIIYVLMSGGVDSTTCAALAKVRHPKAEIYGLSFLYGQRHTKEVEYAAALCHRLDIHHILHNITGVLPRSGVTDPGQVIPQKAYSDLGEGISPSFVAFRNGTHLSIAAALLQQRIKEYEDAWNAADSIEAMESGEPPEAHGFLYHGAHADDAANWAYPDCTPEFLGAMANAIFIGTYMKIRLMAPMQHMMKAEIVRLGTGLGVNLSDTWSCYEGGEIHCGMCPTCQSRQEAFLGASVQDATQYTAVRSSYTKHAAVQKWQFKAGTIIEPEQEDLDV